MKNKLIASAAAEGTATPLNAQPADDTTTVSGGAAADPSSATDGRTSTADP